MKQNENFPKRRSLLEIDSFKYQLNGLIKSLSPQHEEESTNLIGYLSPLVDDLYPYLESSLSNDKNFGGMPADWSSSLLFNYYLKKRTPLPQHCNYAFVLNDFLPTVIDPLEKAANFVLNTFSFLKEKVEEDFCGTSTNWGVVDNTIYNKFIHLSRRPGKEMDSVACNSWNDVQSILVIYNGHYYKVPLTSPDHKVYSVREITEALSHIVAQKKEEKNPFPIGVFTSLNRNKWAGYQKSLYQLEDFPQFLDEMEKSLFVLAMDLDEKPSNKTEALRLAVDRNFKNRWYDKSLNISITGNGIMSLNFDHLTMDGSPALEMVNSAFKRGKNITSESGQFLKVKELNSPNIDPVISKELQKLIEDKISKEQKKISCVHQSIGLGTDVLKKLGMRPDMSFQLFIQMASFLTFQSIPCTGQAVEMRTFEYGRYDTVISNFPNLKILMELFDKADSLEGFNEFLALFQELSENQKNKVVDCKKGRAFLTTLQALLAWDLPFEDLKYLKLSVLKSLLNFHPLLKMIAEPDLPTSGIPHTEAIDAFVFTDFGKDKLGVAYIIGPQEITLGIYGLGNYQEKKDLFIKNLQYVIGKFLGLFGEGPTTLDRVGE